MVNYHPLSTVSKDNQKYSISIQYSFKFQLDRHPESIQLSILATFLPSCVISEGFKDLISIELEDIPTQIKYNHHFHIPTRGMHSD